MLSAAAHYCFAIVRRSICMIIGCMCMLSMCSLEYKLKKDKVSVSLSFGMKMRIDENSKRINCSNDPVILGRSGKIEKGNDEKALVMVVGGKERGTTGLCNLIS